MHGLMKEELLVSIVSQVTSTMCRVLSLRLGFYWWMGDKSTNFVFSSSLVGWFSYNLIGLQVVESRILKPCFTPHPALDFKQNLQHSSTPSRSCRKDDHTTLSANVTTNLAVGLLMG